MPGALSFLDTMDNNALLNLVSAKFPDAVPYPATVKEFVTAGILLKIMPEMSSAKATMLSDIFNKTAASYGLNSPKVFAAYIAECAHESKEFTNFSENLNYPAQRLAEVWPYRYSVDPKAKVKTPNALALRIQHQPEAIANNCYCNRLGNGSEASGDGWLFRGSGPIQMTGRDIIRAYGKYKYRTDVETLANEIRTDIRTAVDSSMWVFVVDKKLIDEAQAGDIDAISDAINGGTNGEESRRVYYTRALAALPSN